MLTQYNNTTRKWEPAGISNKGIIYVDSKYIEYGVFNIQVFSIPICFEGNLFYIYSKECCHVPLYWRNDLGCYTFNIREENNVIMKSKECFNYPIGRRYNLSKLNLEPQKLAFLLKEEAEFKYINKFTFGFEFETSGGNVPWIQCLENNLVPLYDGSISGHEYVTFPLKHDELPLIKSHLELLKRFTKYNHNCSLHIHFGGFPIIYDKIEALCKFWNKFQWKLSKYIPHLSYYVERYKDNGKPYNQPLNILQLKKFYENTTANKYVNNDSFYLPNQFDVEEERKWNVNGRYYNMNIMHLISGGEHKTVEFRFLRPTYNYSEIKWYLLVLGAFLNYVTSTDDNNYSKLTIKKVIKFTFPKEIASKLITEGYKLYLLHKIQVTNNDAAGINDRVKSIYLHMFHNFNI